MLIASLVPVRLIGPRYFHRYSLEAMSNFYFLEPRQLSEDRTDDTLYNV